MEPLSGTAPLLQRGAPFREKVFPCDIYARPAAAAPRASLVLVEADFAPAVLGSDGDV